MLVNLLEILYRGYLIVLVVLEICWIQIKLRMFLNILDVFFIL